MAKTQITFTDFKDDFYSRISDFSLFDCGDANLLKVVLDGLRVKYVTKGKISSDFLMNPVLYDLKFFLKRLRSNLRGRTRNDFNEKLTKRQGKILVGFSERSHKTIEPERSIYFERIFDLLGRGSVTFIGEASTTNNGIADFRLYDLINFYSLIPLNQTEKLFLKELKISFNRIKKSGVFNKNEIDNIAMAFEVFFLHFKAWNKILKLLEPSVAVFDQHYHREGFIFSCKQNSIRTVELQHGLIVPEDIFYVFPKKTEPVISKALFADEIFVYGNYWKDNLKKGVEYAENKIKTIGYYHYEPLVEIKDEEFIDFCGDSDIVLIATQTSMSKTYCNYVKGLSDLVVRKNYNWKIVVKIHPSEKLNDYFELSSLTNCMVVQHPINFLLNISKIHISVYSTTLYDAHRFNVLNFSLVNETYRDYCERIVNDKIAFPLNESDDPIKFYKENNSQVKFDKNHLYENFNEKKFMNNLSLK